MIKLEQYRDSWLKEKMDEVIGFYPREFYCLDNFSSFKVEYKGYLYASLEEAYQASKFLDSVPEIAKQIQQSHSAHEAQKIAFANRNSQHPKWDEIKLSVMEELLRAKLDQNPYVKKNYWKHKIIRLLKIHQRTHFGDGEWIEKEKIT